MLPVLLIGDNTDRINSHIATLLEKEQILDVFYYGEKDSIVIDTIRDINRSTQQPAFRKRAFILFDFHNVKKEAQNALLKTLEERNEENLFIIIAHDEYKILSTILSRCRIDRLIENKDENYALLESLSLFDDISSHKVLQTTQMLGKGDHAEVIHQLRTYFYTCVHNVTIDARKRVEMYALLELIYEVEHQLKNNIYPEFSLDYLLLRIKQSNILPLPKVDDL